MLRALFRFFSLSPARRSLDAAGGGRRWQDAPTNASAGTIHANASTIGIRAQHFALNNPTGARISESYPANLVGDGIKPRSEHEEETVRRVLHRLWKVWTDDADADGQTDFYGLQQMAVRDMVVFGEALFVFAFHPETGAPQLRRLHPEQLDRTKTQTYEHGALIYQGVEFDASGRKAAYWIRQKSPPGDMLAGLPLAPVRIPASEVIHLFRALVPGQVRGLSWFAPVLLAAKELDAVLDALIVRTKVAALHAGFITDVDGKSIYDGETTDGTQTAGLEPGALINLPPGKNIQFPDTPDQGGASDLLTATFRLIAAGTNTTYEQATGDYSNVNYSSARQALLEYRRFCQSIQHHVLVFGFCRPVWKAFVRDQVLRGFIPASDYAADKSAFEAVKWLPPAWPWIDPKNDAKAAETSLKNHLRSRAEIIAERGYDAEDVDAEIAADTKRLKDLYVTPSPETLTEAVE